MDVKLNFHNKAVNVNLSKSARQKSQQQKGKLIIEIQVYFSCLLGKRLAYYSAEKIAGAWQLEQDIFDGMLQDAQPISDSIFIRFNTVMTKHCPVSDYAGPPPVTDFTIKNQKPYVPDWLDLDFKDGYWCGGFGWHASKRGDSNTRQVRAEAI